MAERRATAEWRGNLEEGGGSYRTGTGTVMGDVTFGSRFEEENGSNPEELLGAAEATCFAMALSHELTREGFQPERVQAEAFVDLGKNGDGYEIGTIRLNAIAHVDDIDEDRLREIAQKASQNSPVARALSGVSIRVDNVTLRP